MLFFGIKNSWFRLGVFFVLTILTAFFVWKMHENFYFTDPYNPNLEGTAAYGHNGADAFQSGLRFILIEYFVLLIVLVPFSFSRFYWLRPLILNAVFGGWMMLMAVAGMHGGGVHAIHVVWLLAVNIILFVLFAASLAADISGRKKMREAAQH